MEGGLAYACLDSVLAQVMWILVQLVPQEQPALVLDMDQQKWQ